MSSGSVSGSPLDFPEEPDLTYTDEDYQETTVQVGSLRQSLWYLKMYGLAREAYYQLYDYVEAYKEEQRKEVERQIREVMKQRNVVIAVSAVSIPVLLLLSALLALH
jgi:hypothetical protein